MSACSVLQGEASPTLDASKPIDQRGRLGPDGPDYTIRSTCLIPTPPDNLSSILSSLETVTIHVLGVLRTYCGGAEQLHTSARTVRAALDDLERHQFALYRNI